MKKILLTFDVEEFDLPREFGEKISDEKSCSIPKKGLERLILLLDKYNIKATFFTTANFAKKFPGFIRGLSEKHEIACHGYKHSDSYASDISGIQKAKTEIENIIKKKIHGFRAPRFDIKNIRGLHDFGFSYDSSKHPTWIPGRYMNCFEKRKIHKIGEITEIPLSTLPFARLPIFWLVFKNFGLNYAKAFTKINPDYTMLVLHPWEFEDIEEFNIPKYIKSKSGKQMCQMLEKYILFCKKNDYSFETISSHLKNCNWIP